MAPPRIAVIGHVEWVTFAHGVAPGRGEIALLDRPFDLPAGGGAVTAVELARLGADVRFLTALGGDPAGATTRHFLEDRGVEVRSARRSSPQTRALTVLDPTGERTIAVLGDNLQPTLADDLGWADLDGFDAVYFTGGDVETLEAGRRAPCLVATARRLAIVAAAPVAVDVLVGSVRDPGERLDSHRIGVPPRAVVETDGDRGGRWRIVDGASGRWAATPLTRPAVDSYGAGDCFLAGLTFALARGATLQEAVACGSVRGAEAVTRHGPYTLPS